MATPPKKSNGTLNYDAFGTFAANLRALVQERQRANPGLTYAKMAKEIGISTRALQTARLKENAPNLTLVGKVAEYFELEPWQLLLPDLYAEVLTNPKVAKTIRDYIKATDDGRKAVENVVELVPKRAA